MVADDLTTTGLGAITGLPLLDCAKVDRGAVATPLIRTGVVATFTLVTGVVGATRTTQATREHDGRVAPLRDQHRVFEGIRAGQQHLGADLILQPVQELEESRRIVQCIVPELQLKAPELVDIALDRLCLAKLSQFPTELQVAVNVCKLRSQTGE